MQSRSSPITQNSDPQRLNGKDGKTMAERLPAVCCCRLGRAHASGPIGRLPNEAVGVGERESNVCETRMTGAGTLDGQLAISTADDDSKIIDLDYLISLSTSTRSSCHLRLLFFMCVP
jgi:hypothetical protein